jgi:ElaB/YqjD/DUF883 family membrane-anchored ribosome-binding protein
MAISSFKIEEESLHDTTDETLHSAKAIVNDVAEKVQNRLTNIPSVIRRHPYESLAVGLGLGVAIGLIARQLFKHT